VTMVSSIAHDHPVPPADTGVMPAGTPSVTITSPAVAALPTVEAGMWYTPVWPPTNGSAWGLTICKSGLIGSTLRGSSGGVVLPERIAVLTVLDAVGDTLTVS